MLPGIKRTLAPFLALSPRTGPARQAPHLPGSGGPMQVKLRVTPHTVW